MTSNKKASSFFKNYMAMIENCQGSKIFRNFYFNIDGQEKDILENGRLACAVSVSSVLFLLNSMLEFAGNPRWIKFTHANTASTEKDMVENGWRLIEELKPGAVLVWEKRNANGSQNWHMGFYVGDEMAISNDSGLGHTGVPHKHHYSYQGTRKVEKIYWHPELDA